MEFGDKARFAIALELDGDHGGSWLFGRICYWIAGKVVGRYDLGTSLRDVLFQMTYIIGDGGQRFCPTLLRLPNDKVFDLILKVIGETSEEIYQYIPQDFLPARFDVRIPVDVFDSWKIFLVDGLGEARLLYRELDASEVGVAILVSGEFDKVFRDTHAFLEDIYNAAAGDVMEP